MKKGTLTLIGIFFLGLTISFGQVQNIELEQVKGKFTTESLVLGEGDYQFNISNNAVGHDVGFVVVPAGQYEAANHIKEAYVTAPVATGTSESTSVVSLAPGEDEYFCPLNKTPKYKLTVLGGVETIRLGQVPGDFKVKSLTVAEGTYQFEIANNGVDHEVGFVLVPQGKYDAANHIKEAYVKSTVANGDASLTSIVDLKAGTYEYFCPLNPTPKYTLIVE